MASDRNLRKFEELRRGRIDSSITKSKPYNSDNKPNSKKSMSFASYVAHRFNHQNEIQRKVASYQIWMTVFASIGTGLIGFGVASQTLAGAMIIQGKTLGGPNADWFLQVGGEFLSLGSYMLFGGLMMVIIVGIVFSTLINNAK